MNRLFSPIRMLLAVLVATAVAGAQEPPGPTFGDPAGGYPSLIRLPQGQVVPGDPYQPPEPGGGLQGLEEFCAGETVQEGFFVGADVLLIRPHFSEAIAFVRGTQTPNSFHARTEALDFDYDAALRAFIGYRVGASQLRFTYTHLHAETAVSAHELGDDQFIIDPFGNVMGAVGVFNPADNRFGTVIPGGDSIQTRASVNLNVYDIDYVTPLWMNNPTWSFQLSRGTRIAQVDQFYESAVSAGLGGMVPPSRGDFSTEFTGAGPRLGFGACRHFGQHGQLSMFTTAHGSLLVGRYEINSGNTVEDVFAASQRQRMTRLIPVAEIETGISWQVRDSLRLSAGWLFHAWFDLGVSGGTFGGFFAGADDANLMSFDGGFLRAEWMF